MVRSFSKEVWIKKTNKQANKQTNKQTNKNCIHSIFWLHSLNLAYLAGARWRWRMPKSASVPCRLGLLAGNDVCLQIIWWCSCQEENFCHREKISWNKQIRLNPFIELALVWYWNSPTSVLDLHWIGLSSFGLMLDWYILAWCWIDDGLV